MWMYIAITYVVVVGWISAKEAHEMIREERIRHLAACAGVYVGALLMLLFTAPFVAVRYLREWAAARRRHAPAGTGSDPESRR